MSDDVNEVLRRHLIRADGQEDLTFALYTPSVGASRFSGMIHTVLLPEAGDRTVHGSVSFNPQYTDRVCREALKSGSGVVLLHSHPYPGWQGMSRDDVRAEERLAGAALGVTNLPLLGMTTGSDGTWSGRFWEHVGGREYRREWAGNIRVVGQRLHVDFTDDLLPVPEFQEMFRRTVSVWGKEHHSNLARLWIGIVGLGSVGALVAETLARMGFTQFVLIDFDMVERHNLDRLVIATREDIGRLKVDVAKERIEAVGTAGSLDVRVVPASVVEKEGYLAALDCDVLFSCVDRPRARHILNHFAYAHLIPVIDGGIGVRFSATGDFKGVEWQAHTVGPERPCLQCLGQYDQADVSTEAAGMLDDPSYLAGLPNDHRFKRNENVFPFSANLASLEVLHLVALATGTGGIDGFGAQRFRYNPGIVELVGPDTCGDNCDQQSMSATGDTRYSLVGRDLAAERSRSLIARVGQNMSIRP